MLEVGLGGRLDATNVVDPLVSVITSISYDHMSVLGNTLTEIAAEKGGIIKPGRPVVVSPQKPESLEALREIAKERHAPLFEVDLEYDYLPLSHSLKEQTFMIKSRLKKSREEISAPHTTQTQFALIGSTRSKNAATAVAASTNSAGCFSITRKSIKTGLGMYIGPPGLKSSGRIRQ